MFGLYQVFSIIWTFDLHLFQALSVFVFLEIGKIVRSVAPLGESGVHKWSAWETIFKPRVLKVRRPGERGCFLCSVRNRFSIN